jgi:PleD family two-component response regulator
MSGTVAIVDDDRDLGAIIYRRLRGVGYKCILIPESEKAFPVIKSKKPDLAILDVMMPKVSGFELCRQIRRDPLIFMTPVLMLSALGGDPEINHARQQGADDYLIKPFDIGTLFAKVKGLMEMQARAMKVNAITGFHGVDYMKRVLTNRLLREELIAVCYLSLTHFVPYGRAYGETKRDKAVKLLSNILKDVTRDSGVYECALSHLGGSDFMVMLSAKDFERYCNEVASRFQAQRGALYTSADLERGTITAPKPDGGAEEHPLMSVAVGAVTTENLQFQDSAQIVKVAGEVNRRAQEQQHNGHLEILREGILL